MQQQTRPHIEDAQVLSITALLSTHAASKYSLLLDAPPAKTRWAVQFLLRLDDTTGEVEVRYEVKIEGAWEIREDTLRLEATQPTFGGRRWWFLCPVTGKRAAKLYLFTNQSRFCHRTGIDPAPTYLSQRVAASHRVYRRLYALRARLPGQGSILETLRRPLGMHLTTYMRLLQRDEAIWNSPQNPATAWVHEFQKGSNEGSVFPVDSGSSGGDFEDDSAEKSGSDGSDIATSPTSPDDGLDLPYDD